MKMRRVVFALTLMLVLSAFAGFSAHAVGEVRCLGWFGTSLSSHIDSVELDGADISSSDVTAGLAPGQTMSLCVTPAAGYEIRALMLRYERKNHSLSGSRDSSGRYTASFTVPASDFEIVIHTQSARLRLAYYSDGELIHEQYFSPPETARVKSADELSLSKAGFSFDGWSADGVKYAPGDIVSVPMSLHAVWIADDIPPVERFPVTVSGGAADKSAAAPGERVNITAGPAPAGMEFDRWQAVPDSVIFDDPCAESTGFIMPSGGASVSASYKSASQGSGGGGGTYVPPAKTFRDVPDGVWYREAVYYTVSRGLMYGVSDELFDPEGGLSRAMLVTVLYRLEGRPAARGENVFTDVPRDSWYENAVLWGEEHKIVYGFGDGTFRPDVLITREQTAAIIMRYMAYSGKNTDSRARLDGFRDEKSVSFWARNAVSWACAEGFMSGRAGNTLAPLSPATRAECASILRRVCIKTEK